MLCRICRNPLTEDERLADSDPVCDSCLCAEDLRRLFSEEHGNPGHDGERQQVPTLLSAVNILRAHGRPLLADQVFRAAEQIARDSAPESGPNEGAK